MIHLVCENTLLKLEVLQSNTLSLNTYVVDERSLQINKFFLGLKQQNGAAATKEKSFSLGCQTERLTQG